MRPLPNAGIQHLGDRVRNNDCDAANHPRGSGLLGCVSLALNGSGAMASTIQQFLGEGERVRGTVRAEEGRPPTRNHHPHERQMADLQ